MLFLVKVYPITTVFEKKQSQISVIPADEEGKKPGSSKELTQKSLSDLIQGKPQTLSKIFCIMI